MSDHKEEEEPPPWFLQELQRRLPPDFSISQAIREAMHLGMEMERAKRTHLNEPERCKKHLAPLRQVAPGVWECPFKHLHVIPQRITAPRDTDPLPQARMMPAKRYILEKQERQRIDLQDTQWLPIIRKESQP